MGMWLPIILICSAPYAQTCTVITGLELVSTHKQCFEESIKKAKVAMESPSAVSYTHLTLPTILRV